MLVMVLPKHIECMRIAQLKFQAPHHILASLIQQLSIAKSIMDVQIATDGFRKTREMPPRVSVYDVIAIVKGCSRNYAGNVFRRLLAAGNVPACEEVSPNLLEETIGQGGHPVFVATAEEIVQICCALPGNAEFRQHCAGVVVKYLAGDLSLVEEIFRNRAAQEQLAVEAPEHPARFFGEAVETMTRADLFGNVANRTYDATFQDLVQGVVNAAEARFTEFVRRELQRTHPWDFNKHANPRNSLADIGVIVEGEELAELDDDEHVVRIVDFLKERLAPATWRQHGNKLKNIFAIELKKQKIEQYQADGMPFFIARAQGEFRILYTEADHELMVAVFNKCKRRFSGIVTRDEALLKSRRKQRRIEDYFTAPTDGAGDASGVQCCAGGDAVVEKTRPGHTSASASSGHHEGAVLMHRDAVPEAPPELRIAAKRGDADVNINV